MGRRRREFLTRLQLGHFLHVDADALAVEQHEVDGFDGRRHGGHEVAGNGLEDQLGRRLLGEPIPGSSRKQREWNKQRVQKHREPDLPPAADRGESHRLELLLVRQGQAVLHRLVQHLLTLVGAPARTVTVDHVLGREAKAGRQNS